MMGTAMNGRSTSAAFGAVYFIFAFACVALAETAFPYGQLLRLLDEEPKEAEHHFTLRISENGMVGGRFWCNYFGGMNAEIIGDHLAIRSSGQSIQTAMACNPDVDAAVASVFRVLSDGTWSVVGAELHVRSADRTLRFQIER